LAGRQTATNTGRKFQYGITRQQLHNLIAGRSAAMPEMAVKLEKALG
jgi:plasmid maintenance system antidote protein VapI